MYYSFIFFPIMTVLVISAILATRLYFFRQSSNGLTLLKLPPIPLKLDFVDITLPPIRLKPGRLFLDNDDELIQLRQHLKQIVLHDETKYQGNINIAREDFAKRGFHNPSEIELTRRAIQIWIDEDKDIK
ncbi:MAG: hypothetical protein K1X72_23230 [Pyrinomonadaceae bacterium]|nr:hypothetical protein [Pyrinomonadaceae bacterium]